LRIEVTSRKTVLWSVPHTVEMKSAEADFVCLSRDFNPRYLTINDTPGAMLSTE